MTFELQPALAGRLLRLRPLNEADFEALYAVAKDPLIWEQHPSSDRYKLDVFTSFFRDAMASGGALLASDCASGEVIGSSRFVNLRADEIEVGYSFLARRCWGHTYNREMKHLMLSHAFRFVPKVSFVIGEKNGRSRAAIERIGARLADDPPRPGSVRYRLTRQEFTRA